MDDKTARAVLNELRQMRSQVRTLRRRAGIKLGKPLPRATRRPPGPKFRDQLCGWVRADAQEQLEAAGVPQSNIDSCIRAVCEYGIRSTDWKGGYKFFETQQDAIDFLSGKLDIDVGGTGGMKNYPDIIAYFAETFGAGVAGYRDKVKALMNKMSPKQKALAYWAFSESPYPRQYVEKLEDLVTDNTKEFYEAIIPQMEWALKVSEPPKGMYG